MHKCIMTVFSLLLVFAAAAYAGDAGGRPGYRGDGPDLCSSDWGASCSGMRVNICPQGDFELISEGCGTGNDYIWVEVLDWGSGGISGIPATDFWLQAIDPTEQLCLCANPLVADSITNSAGRTTFSGPIAGGGCALNGLYLRVQGITILEDWSGCTEVAVRDIVIVSPDLTTDCRVNLSDLGVFGLSYNKNLGDSGFNTCCDYNDDDKCNLSDFAWFAEHYRHECF